jgi:hypothetical protein
MIASHEINGKRDIGKQASGSGGVILTHTHTHMFQHVGCVLNVTPPAGSASASNCVCIRHCSHLVNCCHDPTRHTQMSSCTPGGDGGLYIVPCVSRRLRCGRRRRRPLLLPRRRVLLLLVLPEARNQSLGVHFIIVVILGLLKLKFKALVMSIGRTKACKQDECNRLLQG